MNLFFYLIIGVAVALAISFLTKSTGKKVTVNSDGYYKLRMNKLYGIVGIIGIVIGLVILIFFLVDKEYHDSGFIFVVLLMLAIFWGAGIPCLLYAKNHTVSFDDNCIHVINAFGKQKTVEWGKISRINFKAMLGLIVIESETKKVKVHQHLVGLSKFIEMLEEHTPWTNRDLKVPLSK